VTAIRVTITVDDPMVADARNFREVAAMMMTMEADAMIVMTQQQKPVMTTRVLAKPREDAAEDHQVVAAAVRQTMGRVVTLTTVDGVPDDHVLASRRMTPLLRSLTEPDQKVSSLSTYHHCQS
jgi:hypothetical protein